MEKYQFATNERTLMEKSRIPFAVYQFIEKRVVTLILSDGFCSLFGYDDKAQAYYDMDNDMYKDVHIDDAARIADAAVRFATQGGTYEVIYRSKSNDGTGYNIIHAAGEHVYTDTGVRLAYIWYTNEGPYELDSDSQETTLNNLLKNALHEKSAIKSTHYDYLTGLPSMTYFFELAAAKNIEWQKQGVSPSILFMDFNGMKYFNHKHGFSEGNNLLQAFSRLLAQYYGNENCSRFESDHFVVLANAEQVEDTLRRLFEECKELNNGLTLPLHIGIYLCHANEQEIITACDKAKLACDSLKHAYTSEFTYYNTNLRIIEEKQQYIIANLDRAIAENWITVYYQPIVRAVSGRVCDEEALVRWIDPVKGFLSPADFIPILEDARLIYKLDLCVLDRVIEKIKIMESKGMIIVPQSINLSRSDFDSCDMVEQIRERVDKAGIAREKITIEITESIIGSDFDFIKEQVSRFRELGFPVWMDDFGSGYSSLNVLQSIQFDLIKFDMTFMRQLDNGESGKIILAELMKMAAFLGVDTVCEGVETEAQVQFLRETGCSKLQGFYYGKPLPLEKILERYETGMQIGFEPPKESRYYETIGKINLHDFAVIAQGDNNEFSNYFNTMPMAIIELKDHDARFSRTNQSYRYFMKRYFGLTITGNDISYDIVLKSPGASFMKAVRQVADEGSSVLIDETLPDNSTVHYLARPIAANPATNAKAVAVVVLTVTDAEQGTSYANIARALATDYFDLFYVNLETEQFTEYSSAVGEEDLAMERHGEHFFTRSREDALKHLYPEDRKSFVESFTKEDIIRELDKQGSFTLTYRLMKDEKPFYVNMKVMRMQKNGKHIVIGVSNVDSQMKQKEMITKARQEQIAYSRLMALSDDYISMYTVDCETDQYFEYRATSEFEQLGIAKTGEDFFTLSQENAKKVLIPEDYPKFRERFTKEKIMQEIEENGIFMIRHRLMLGGKTREICTKAVLVKENGKNTLIVATRDDSIHQGEKD